MTHNIKLHWLLVLLFLVAGISPVVPVCAQSEEWETFVSDDGRLTIDYPVGWTVEDQSAEVGVPAFMFTNRPALPEQDQLQPGQLSLIVGLIPLDVFASLGMEVDPDLAPDALVLLLSGMFFPTVPDTGHMTTLSSGQSAGYVEIEDESSQGNVTLIAFYQSDIVIFVVVEAGADAAAAEIGLTLAGSVRYSGTGADLLDWMATGNAESSTDFSALSYAEAFDALLDMMRDQYVFTEIKQIDWDQKAAEFRPRFEAADQQQDREAYLVALRDFAWSFGDGHLYSQTSFMQRLTHAYEPGGLGLAARELDDGRVVVTFVLPDGPGDQAGIEPQAEIIQIDGQPVGAALDVVAVPGAFGPPENRRLEQQRALLRFAPDLPVEIVFQNPGGEPSTTTLVAVAEQESLEYSSIYRPNHATSPAEFRQLDNGYMYIQLTSFAGDRQSVIETWHTMIETLRAGTGAGLIVDLRQNGGGDGLLALQLASTFFTEPVPVGYQMIRSEESGELVINGNAENGLSLDPPAESLRYDGPVAVLIDPACFSACEIFAYVLREHDRAAIVGQYPTAGAFGADAISVFMPEEEIFQFPVMALVDANQQILIEDYGVAPTVRVPVTLATLFDTQDPVLESAIAVLDTQHSGQD